MKMETIPIRKNIRLRDWDYGNPGHYFVTMCTSGKKCMLWSPEGMQLSQPYLSDIGMIVNSEISKTNTIYTNISIDKYVVMPNHVHMIIYIAYDAQVVGKTTSISNIINHFKGSVTKQVGRPIWQLRFHDHIIRNERKYNEIWQYIDTNPQNWRKDCFFTE